MLVMMGVLQYGSLMKMKRCKERKDEVKEGRETESDLLWER